MLPELVGGVPEGETVEACEEEGGKQEVEGGEAVVGGEGVEEAGEPGVEVGVEVGELS